jgi:hypothetical protein
MIMNAKLVLAAACVLFSSACVSTSSQYRNDIVYRDGSYYSPADEQYGDYYYAPEQDVYDYGYYADAYDRFEYDRYYSPWYGYSNSRRCRYSYRYDRDCTMFGWGSSALHFGSFSLIIGRGYGRNYGYDRGYYNDYYGNSYGYGYGSPYYYSGHSYGYNGFGSSYYNGYSHYYSRPYYYHPRPRPDYQAPRGAIAMPKPSRPNNPIIDNSVSTDPGVRAGGEYAQPQRRIGRLETPTETVVNDARDQNSNNYRPRSPRNPGNWNTYSGNDGQPINNKRPVRIDQERPAPVIIWNQNSNPENNKQPRRLPVIVNDNQDDSAPYIRPQRQEYRRQVPMPEREVVLPVQRERIARIDQPAPVRYEQTERAPVRYERIERAERPERREAPQRVERQERAQEQVNNKGPRRLQEDEGNQR